MSWQRPPRPASCDHVALVIACVLLVSACRDNRPPDTPPASAAAQAAQATVTRTGTLRIGSSSVDAQISVDTVLVGTGRLSVSLPAGSHLVSVRASGFRPFDSTVSVPAGETTTIFAALEKLP